MSKRPKTTNRSSPTVIIVLWVGTLLSIGLLFLAGSVLVADFGSLRSCSVNNGLTATNCGKQSLNGGDIMITFLFVLSAVLVVTLFTHAWRCSRGERG